MFAIMDWQTQSLVVELGTDQVRLFDAYEDALQFGQKELQQGLWTVLPVPEDAMFYID